MRETTPSDGLRVVLLWLLSGPDVCALNGKKNVALVVDDTVHEHEVKNRADQCSDNLCGEGSPWRELGVLGNLEVAQEELGLVHRVCENMLSTIRTITAGETRLTVREQNEVHVRHRFAGMNETTNHLNERLNDEL